MNRILILLIMAFMTTGLFAASDTTPITSNIQSGVYIFNDLIIPNKLRKLPVPSTQENYVILQSIKTVTNIVIGDFQSNERRIILITDKNIDEKVDSVYYYYIDKDRLVTEPVPANYITDEKFKKIKNDIIMGKSGDVSPNQQGMNFILTLVKNPANMKPIRDGYEVSQYDPDNQNISQITFSYADYGINGVDLVYNVRYNNVGVNRVSPLINVNVYAKNSFDPAIINTVKELMKQTPKK